MKRLFKQFAVFLFVAVAVPAWSSFPLATDIVKTTPPNRTGLEMGYSIFQPQSGEQKQLLFTIKRGILGNLELGADLPVSLSTPTGLQDITLNAKVKVLQFSKSEGLSIKLSTKLANGSPSLGTGTGYPDYGISAILSQGFGLLTGHLNLGYTMVGVPAGAASANYTSFSLAVETIYFADHGELFAEIAGNSSVTPAPLTFQLGSRFWLGDYTQFVIGYGKGLSDSGYQSALQVGLTTEI
ncbi:MAG: hypothetical protein ABIH56_04355 [Candidatus Margulisiibacteriota bacterium]